MQINPNDLNTYPTEVQSAVRSIGRIDFYDNFTDSGRRKLKPKHLNPFCEECCMMIPPFGEVVTENKVSIWICPDCDPEGLKNLKESQAKKAKGTRIKQYDTFGRS